MTIEELFEKYKGKLDRLDLEILIAHSLGKTRELVLTYPEKSMTKHQTSVISKLIERRIGSEPIAYLIGHKEFYGFDFILNEHTLIPRPETELLVENVLQLIQDTRHKIPDTKIVDVGTGSGCIITSIANIIEHGTCDMEQKKCISFYATDISIDALEIAKKNSRKHGVDTKIKFLHGNLLEPFIQDTRYEVQDTNLIIIANLPYLSEEIYQSAPIDVKKFEPRSALFSDENGLAHYRELLEQINALLISDYRLPITIFLEISPEQKQPLIKIIKNIFPLAKIKFKKDLAGKWRVCGIEIK